MLMFILLPNRFFEGIREVGVGPDDLREEEPPKIVDGDERSFAAAKVQPTKKPPP